MRRCHLHLISDSTGETVSSVARAVFVQFDDVEPIEHSWSLVRTQSQIDKVLAAIKAQPGIVLYTLVGTELQQSLADGCRILNVPCIPVLDQVINGVSAYLGVDSGHVPGRQHVLDEDYFARIDAMQFVLAHDDGQALHDVHLADVILVGVSRTSKTPTCVYLANRGVRAANVPYVPDLGLPEDVLRAEQSLVVGLTTSPENLVQVRRSRLQSLDQVADTDYVDLDAVRAEVRAAKRLFAAQGWPVIDVARRSIEETATAVLTLYRNRHDRRKHKR